MAGFLVSVLGFRSALMTMGIAGIVVSTALATTSIRTETFDAMNDPAPSAVP